MVFTDAQLREIRPKHIVDFLTAKAYGTTTPTEEDLPRFARANTLRNNKKAISHFMPEQQEWNDASETGNPTRHGSINRLIGKVQRLEVARQGRPNLARREFEDSEFEQLIQYTLDDTIHERYLFGALWRFQLHMIGRVDDVSKFFVANLTHDAAMPYILSARLCWSKNCHRESDAPKQTILAAWNSLYCTILGLAIHLETWIACGDGEDCQFVFGVNGRNNPTSSSKSAQKYMQTILKSNQFFPERDGLLGTHSLRKYGATLARRGGASMDDVELRGRWTNSRRMVNRYVGSTLPYPDAKVAAALCPGGPITYMCKEASGIPGDEWISQNIVPFTARRLPLGVCGLLGRALLYAVYEEEIAAYLPHALNQRVRDAYESLPNHMEQGNPIYKRRLIVNNQHGDLIINLMPQLPDNPNSPAEENGGTVVHSTDSTANQFIALRTEMQEMMAHMLQVESRIAALTEFSRRHADRVDTNFRQLRERAALVINNTRNNNPQSAPQARIQAPFMPRLAPQPGEKPAALCKMPRNLHVLWQEYEVGIGGRKAAKDLTARERGLKHIKHKYYSRKFVWKVIIDHVNRGYSASLAIDRIYATYGRNRSITQIIRALKDDANRYANEGGVHPNLRV